MTTPNTVIGARDGVFYVTNHGVDPGKFFFGDDVRAAAGNAVAGTERSGA